MSTAGSARVAVLLIGLPGFYEGLLRQEFGPDSGVVVARLAEGAGPDALASDVDLVIVVRATAPSLRRAARLLSRSSRIIGAIAVTDEEPRGDVYLVLPAVLNASRHELAQVIRDVVAGDQARPAAARPFSRALIRSDS